MENFLARSEILTKLTEENSHPTGENLVTLVATQKVLGISKL
jgi:hypothetical protein